MIMHVKYLKQLKECINLMANRINEAEKEYKQVTEGTKEITVPLDEYTSKMTKVVIDSEKIQDVLQYIADLDLGCSSVRMTLHRPTKEEMNTAFLKLEGYLEEIGITSDTQVKPSNVVLIKCLHACKHYQIETQMDSWYDTLPLKLERGLLVQREVGVTP